MEMSTPVDRGSRREIDVFQESASSTNNSKCGLPSPFILEGSDNFPSDQEEQVNKWSPIGASLELDKTCLTPTKKPDNSEEFEGGANDMMDAARGSRVLLNDLPESFLKCC